VIAVKPLALVVTCGCGERGRVMPGETWSCPACGRTYGTGDVPEEEYAAVVREVNRTKLRAIGGMAVIAAIFFPLGFILGGELWLTGIVLLAVFYFGYGPKVKRDVRRIIRTLPHWTIREMGDD
jgi:hypothetical protein